MAYLFAGDGSPIALVEDSAARVFVVSGPARCVEPATFVEQVRDICPAFILGDRVLNETTEPILRDLAATVFSESSHDPQESDAILRVILNRAARRAVTLGNASFRHALGAGGIDGRRTGNFQAANSMPVSRWTGNMQSARAPYFQGSA